ncbi:PepSY1/2 domain-containing protein [Fuchsiella alkaliacetigena]|uniref:PepSY1/2 domain-containing protein n=1 Tax=Fuchsiella alkaliacetigena TaxID=957042 RepID=UPI00200AF819|nr:PepSY1/2 domain-containing protein [Fuchsiella alkaliacetigena]MCK8825764.1 germination protein YpeB [Fuchsiella alkaliacetigena]
MKRNIVILGLVIAVVVTGYWGVRTNRILARWELQNENQYRNSFDKINSDFDSLEENLATTLVSQSEGMKSLKLNNIWRDAFSIQENLGRLPIAGISMTGVKKLLVDIEDLTYQLDKEGIGDGLTSEQREDLDNFHTQVKEINSELTEIQNRIEEDGFRWSRQRHIVLEEQEEVEEEVLSALHSLDTQTVQSAEADFAEGELALEAEGLAAQLGALEFEEGAELEDEAAIEIVKDFWSERSEEFTFEVAEEAVDEPGIVTVIAQSKDLNHEGATFDISQSEEEVIWFLEKKLFEEENIELEEARKIAAEFLEANDYQQLVLHETVRTPNVATFNFVPQKEEVLIYPRELAVKVALDEGEIIGFNGRDFLLNKDLELDLEPELSLSQAREKVSEELDLERENLVVIENELGEKILAYEFWGNFKEEQYRVYINAHTAQEERVESGAS